MEPTPSATLRESAQHPAPLLHTKPQASRLLCMSIRSVENAMREKRLAYIRLGKRAIRFRPADLEAFIARHRIRSVAE